MTMTSSDDSTDHVIFSDERVHMSPPSSPPPMLKKDAFSILGKRRALSPIPNNAVTKKTKRTSSDASNLTQLQISLGQTVQKKCPDCGMSYITSSHEDRKLHDKYHKQATQGYDVGKNLIPSLSKKPVPKCVWKITNDDTICRITSAHPSHQKTRAKEVLKIVQHHLGAVEIPEKHLDEVAKYTSYLYIRGTKCVGYLLVEDITKAYPILEPTRPPSSNGNGKANSALAALQARKTASEEEDAQPLRLSTQSLPAVAGVSRIWTSPTHRGQKIARELLNVALEVVRGQQRNQVEYLRKRAVEMRTASEEKKAMYDAVDRVAGYTEDKVRAIRKAAETGDVKGMIAFSQPTVAGTKLARKWFGRRYGWLVYVD